MQQETINKAVESINDRITGLEEHIEYIKSNSSSKEKIEWFECMVKDLATMKTAIENDETKVKISGATYSRDYIRMLLEPLLCAEIVASYDGWDTLYLYPYREMLKGQLVSGTGFVMSNVGIIQVEPSDPVERWLSRFFASHSEYY